MHTRLLFLSCGSLLLWSALLVFSYVDGEAIGAVPVVLLPLFVTMLFGFSSMDPPARYNLLPYFLFSVLMFFCINILLWPFSSQTPFEFYSLVAQVIPVEVMARAAILLGLSLSITMIAYVTFARAEIAAAAPATAPEGVSAEAATIARLGFRLLVVSFPFVAYRLYREYEHIASAGYLALYADGLDSAALNTAWVTPFNYMFSTGFGLICAFGRDRKRFAQAVAIFLVAALLDGIKGARGAVIVPILFCWWFYSSRFGVKIPLRKFTMYAFAGLVVFLALTSMREQEKTDATLSRFVIDSVASQGRSLQLTSIYLQEQEAIAEYGNLMVFANLAIPLGVVLHPELRAAPQSIEHVLYSNNLKHILTYTLNPDYYLSGGGTGGVYLIEIIESGTVLFIALSALLGWFFAVWPRWMGSALPRFLSLQIFSTAFYMPRAELFPNLLILGKAVVVFAVIVLAVRIVRKYYSLPRAPVQRAA